MSFSTTAVKLMRPRYIPHHTDEAYAGFGRGCTVVGTIYSLSLTHSTLDTTYSYLSRQVRLSSWHMAHSVAL